MICRRTIFLIFATCTVRIVIAHVTHRDTKTRIAGKFIRLTHILWLLFCRLRGNCHWIWCRCICLASQFVRIVAAIIHRIAFPPVRNAFLIRTMEHPLLTGVIWIISGRQFCRTIWHQTRTILLITTVRAIFLAITLPCLVNTESI